MEITIHRGSREVGGNCIEVRSGETRIILDIDLPLFDEDRQALNTFALRRQSTADLRRQEILPNVSGLFDDGPSPDAILISHAHLDHTGLLNHSQESIPIHASRGTSKMMLAGSLFARQVELPREQFREITSLEPTIIGDFTVTAYPADRRAVARRSFNLRRLGVPDRG